MEIVKAEILWTRKCPLHCKYCSMSDGRNNTLTTKEWQLGIDQLKKLGCGFIAFYGAEPLYDFDKLPEVVGYAENLGIHTTVITSGCVQDFHNKIDELIDNGAKSLTMSYDMIPLDTSSKAKSNQAIKGLQYFQKKSNYKNRDVAVVATLSRLNYQLLPETIEEMSNRYDIWTFFDFIHHDRGQPGAKTKGTFPELMFTNNDYKKLKQVLFTTMQLKDAGKLCHTSKVFIDYISKDDFYLLKNYNWNCADEISFPSWITIDCNGFVYPCDDFQIPELANIRIVEIADRWEEFSKKWKIYTKKLCPGCAWNTHIDACAIKDGRLQFKDYVHIEKD